MTDWRTLCEELLDELLARPLIPDRALIDRARATLAQPEPEVVEPSDVLDWIRGVEPWATWLAPGGSLESAHFEIARLVAEAVARFVRPAPAPDDRGVLPMIFSETGADDEPELERIICASISGGADYVNSMPRELMLERITPEGSTFARYIQVDADARAVLSRWGRPAPAPAGEVAELVTWLREGGEDAAANGWDHQAQQFARVADLLERQAAPVAAPAVPTDEGEVAELVRRLRYAKQNGNSIPSRIHWGLDDGTEHQGSIYVGSNHAADCARAADLLEQRQVAPVPVLPEGTQVIEPTKRTILVPVAVSERSQQIEDLAADAVGALRYIEQTHGRLYGVGWDRVYKKAERISPALSLSGGEAKCGWQHINTAPKDGTEILASDYDAIEILSWKVYEAGSGWESRWGEGMFPAWWQPLPDHPPLPSVEEDE